MKIQLTSKETRKLTAALGVVDATFALHPALGWVLRGSRNLSSKLVVKEDSSSEIEIHEKSFSTFLESGSEMVINLGRLANQTLSKFASIVKEFNDDMKDAEESVENCGTNFTQEEKEFVIVKSIQLPVDGVPYSIRLNAAICSVKNGVRNSTKAAELFQVNEEHIIIALSERLINLY